MAAEEFVQGDKVEEAFVKVEKKRKTMDKKAKKKRKKIVIWSILGGIVVIIIVISVISSALAKNAPKIVMTQKATQGELISTLTVSGLVESEETKNIFAPSTLKIGDILISQGQTVKKGDKICTFEEDSFADALRISELNNQVADNSYKSCVKKYEENKKKLSAANATISKYEPLIDAQEKKIEDMETAINDDNVKKIADLNAKIYKAQKENSDFAYVIMNAEMFGVDETAIETYTKYKQSNEQQIADWQYQIGIISGSNPSVANNEQQKALTAEKKLLADYEEELGDAKEDKSKAEAIVGDEFAVENIVPNGEISTISASNTYEEMIALKDGVVADSDGIVTSIGGIEGASIPAGSSLVSVASLDSLKVTFNVSKNELKNLAVGQKVEITIASNKYEGTVTKVSHMATIASNGAASVQAEAHINNPDENIYLGLDAKMIITTADVKDALQVPVEAVNADKDGEFIYVAENGIVVKKHVTVGISSDEYIQILDGVTAEDDIICDVSAGVEEGARVTAVPDTLLPGETEETTE